MSRRIARPGGSAVALALAVVLTGAVVYAAAPAARPATPRAVALALAVLAGFVVVHRVDIALPRAPRPYRRWTVS